MRYIPLIHQNTNACNGRSREDKDVCVPGVGVAVPEIAARRPDAQHGVMEIRALMHGGGEEG
jgi:hypothetical protein